MKYAIIESGGKQYKAIEGSTIEVDRLHLDVGKKIDLNDVLLVSDGKKVTVGTPKVSGAKVKAKVVDQFRAPKIIVFKYHPRKRYRLKRGHRQYYTRLEIEAIQTKAPAKKKAEAEVKGDKPKAKPKTKAAKPAAKKPAAKKTAAKKTTKKSPAKKTAPKK
ncbi:MAG: 50S ribosomal protein L21 [Chloroflexi bacterium]|nr:50S ribosomal protein L21 [Chloroflexota bacterium]